VLRRECGEVAEQEKAALLDEKGNLVCDLRAASVDVGLLAGRQPLTSEGGVHLLDGQSSRPGALKAC